MAIFKRPKAGAFMDVIRCDEPSYLIWKWHPVGTESGKNNRENAIRWGSSLRIKDGESVVFVYNQKNGVYQDYILGPYDGILTTENLPILASIIGLAYDGGTPFQSEVYFINLAQIVQVKFGVPFFDVFDPRLPDFGVPVAVRGTISFKIDDVNHFIKLHRLNSFSLEDFQNQIRDTICRYVKDTVANAPAENDIPVIQLETKTAQINDVIEYNLSLRLKENFGVSISGVDLGAIAIDKTSDGYHQLMSVTKDIAAARVKAESTDFIERLRINREEGQYSLHKQIQSANLSAFQIEKQAEVGISAANALGHMGENGAGNVNLGGSITGFNPAAMMAGIALGGAVGQNIADTMKTIISNGNQPESQSTPPEVPAVKYHVVINGEAAGPFDMNTLKQMASTGSISRESLFWKQGMPTWIAAENVPELQILFSNTEMPPIPSSSS